MLLEFIAAIASGLGVAGVMMAARKLTGHRLPGFLVPASAGVAMIAIMVYFEYSWAWRITDRLPEGVVITAESTDAMWYRPWTYLAPVTFRLVAIDTRRSRLNAAQPNQVMTTVMLLGRWMPIREIPVVYDCQRQQRADLDSGVTLADDGALVGARWRDLAEDDRALEVACANIDP